MDGGLGGEVVLESYHNHPETAERWTIASEWLGTHTHTPNNCRNSSLTLTTVPCNQPLEADYKIGLRGSGRVDFACFVDYLLGLFSYPSHLHDALEDKLS